MSRDGVRNLIAAIRTAMGGLTIDAVNTAVVKLYDEGVDDGVDMCRRLIDIRRQRDDTTDHDHALMTQMLSDIAAAQSMLRQGRELADLPTTDRED